MSNWVVSPLRALSNTEKTDLIIFEILHTQFKFRAMNKIQYIDKAID